MANVGWGPGYNPDIVNLFVQIPVSKQYFTEDELDYIQGNIGHEMWLGLYKLMDKIEEKRDAEQRIRKAKQAEARREGSREGSEEAEDWRQAHDRNSAPRYGGASGFPSAGPRDRGEARTGQEASREEAEGGDVRPWYGTCP